MPVPPPGPPPADDKEGLASLGWGFPGTYVVIALAFAWPWFLGTYLAVQFGATNPSLTRTITGSAFEAPWLAFLAFMAFYQLAKRSGARKLGLAQAVKERRIAAKARGLAPQKLPARCFVGGGGGQ
jgi:ABC-type branched-subunit amino acid transport system permease subunit